MNKYVRVMDGTKSNAGGFEYKLDKVNIAKLWNPKMMDTDKMGICANSFNDFRRNGLANPDSILYMGEDNSPKPMYKDVAKVIHEAGGLVFLAHPFEYNFEDTIGFIDKLKNEIKLDGIECFHPSSEIDNRSSILIEYAKKIIYI